MDWCLRERRGRTTRAAGEVVPLHLSRAGGQIRQIRREVRRQARLPHRCGLLCVADIARRNLRGCVEAGGAR